MEPSSACELINNVVYKPGWTFEAETWEKRFEGGVLIKVTYPALASERKNAPQYSIEINDGARAEFVRQFSHSCDDVTVYRCLMDIILDIEQHEAREFLRVKPTMWAPFHPHRVEGMQRWGTPEKDLKFGIA